MPKIVIKHATVYTMDGEDQPKALDILVEDGKIKALRSHIDCSDAREIDASGYIVLPGLIDAHCHIGIFETAIGALGVDGNEISSPATQNCELLTVSIRLMLNLSTAIPMELPLLRQDKEAATLLPVRSSQ